MNTKHKKASDTKNNGQHENVKKEKSRTRRGLTGNRPKWQNSDYLPEADFSSEHERKKQSREQRAESACMCMGVGAGVCVCFVLLIGNLEKKPRSWQLSRDGRGKKKGDETRKGSLFTHAKMSRFFRKRVGLVAPPTNFLLFYFLTTDFFFSCTAITQDSCHSIDSQP